MNWTEEEKSMAIELHKNNCGCSRSALEPADGFGIQGWLEWARDVISARPQKETLF